MVIEAGKQLPADSAQSMEAKVSKSLF